MPLTTPSSCLSRKRKRAAFPADMSKVPSTNIYKRIERAMRMVGVPTTEARSRYARLFSCVRVMRGSAQRWHAAWALYNIIKDWLRCPGDEPASTDFQNTIEQAEEELATLCYEKEECDD
jgi:hypothetical protein